MAGVLSRIPFTALVFGVPFCSYLSCAFRPPAESNCPCEELWHIRYNVPKYTSLQHEAAKRQYSQHAPALAPQFDGLNFFETLVANGHSRS